MDIQTRKIEFIQEFLKVQSEDLVLRLDKIMKKEISKNDIKNKRPFTIAEMQNRISISMNDSKANKLISKSDLLSDIQQWR